MSPLDGIAAAYVAFGAWRGRARGMAEEGYRLFRMAVAFAAGCGLYGVISGLLEKVVSIGGDVSGPVGFVGVVGGSWFLLSRLRNGIKAWLAARFADRAQIGGMAAGGLRALIVVLSIVGVLNLAGRDEVKGRSVVGTLSSWVLR